jgi:mannose PTS system EIIA component
MSSETPLRGVVVAHGPMACGMVDAVRQIAGDAADVLQPISNDGKSPAQLKEELDAAAGNDPVVVFVDMPTGSCGAAALSSCRGRASRRVVVCGVNLPMLLDFVFARNLSTDEVVERVVARGRGAITRPPSPL